MNRGEVRTDGRRIRSKPDLSTFTRPPISPGALSIPKRTHLTPACPPACLLPSVSPPVCPSACLPVPAHSLTHDGRTDGRRTKINVSYKATTVRVRRRRRSSSSQHQRVRSLIGPSKSLSPSLSSFLPLSAWMHRRLGAVHEDHSIPTIGRQTALKKRSG